MRIRSIALFAVLTLASLSAAEPLRAREWFVRAGSDGGDGSQAKPFADPWQALEKSENGDVIHVSGGKYFGKLNKGMWLLPAEGIQLLGGYDNDFKSRDPWTNRSELLWDPASKNLPNEARVKTQQKNCVIDGFVIDMKDQITWMDDKKTSRRDKPMPGENAIEATQAITVRNCVLVNPEHIGVRCPPGSTVENNLIVNAMEFAVSIYTNTGDFRTATATIKGNTLLFTATFKEPGKGAYNGSAIQVNGPVNITNNIIAFQDNNAVYQTFLTEKVSITKNVFHMNLYSNLRCSVDGKAVVIDNKNMGDLEEVGLKAFDGNEILDPQIAIDKDWLDIYSRRTAYQPGKLTMDDWNKTRQLLGLPLIAQGGTPATNVAPAYPLEGAFAFLEPKNAKCTAGARKIKLESKVSGAAAAAPAKTYPKAKLTDWAKKPDTVNGQPMEMIVGISGTTNVRSAPESYDKTKIQGHQLYDPEGTGTWVPGFLMKGTVAERICYEASMKWNGAGKPETLFVVRGIAYEVQGFPKSMFYIESVEKFEAATALSDARPKGRDWFIKAGAAGGNGSKEKPFKDPWQALEKCESGDSIHVAEGEYFGKLKMGIWRIDTSFISLIGGYDADFKERDPWKHPTVLSCPPPDFKGSRGGYTVDGDVDDHTGAIVDGFVFDKKPNNFYVADGDCDASRSDNKEHIWLNKPGCVIRNCVFVNGAGGALRISNGQTIENNIFINHWGRALKVSKGHTAFPITIRNNTMLFAWDLKPGFGRGRTGELIWLETDVRAVIDNNIIAFSDNDGIKLALDPAEVVLTNNAFSHNQWSHVNRVQSDSIVDAANWKQLGDLGFKKCEGNEILAAGVPIEQKWFDVFLNRTAYLPGKVVMDDWNKLREILGQPVLASGGQGPTGVFRAYDWKQALNAFPKNEKCKAGARPVKLEVKFEGVERKEETFEYAESGWDVAKDKTKWDGVGGKRVALKIAIRGTDNDYQLGEVSKEQYHCFMVMSPDDSGGLPLRCYVKRGTKYERVMKNAKWVQGGAKPEESYVIKGVPKPNRQMIVEVIERAD